MKSIFYLLLVLLVAQSCKSYSYVTDYQLEFNRSRLPKLKAITDQELFNENSEDYVGAYSRSIGSARDLHLIERQFNKYVIENLCTPRTDNYGFAVLRINHLTSSNDLSALSTLSVISLGLSTLIGIPAGRSTVEMDISLEILDVNQKIIGVYSGKARYSELVAMYYGYGVSSARNKCMYETIESCINQINTKVMRDFDFLERRLIRTKKEEGALPVKE